MTSHAASDHPDIEKVLISEEEIRDRLSVLGKQISQAYEGEQVVVTAVLKGAFIVLADFARSLEVDTIFDFMAVSSYGASTKSSGVVRILKDLDVEIEGRHVLIVEDIVDSGLTLSYLLKNLRARGPKSVEVMALLVKPDAAKVDIGVKWTGFEVPNEFVVGYGLDYDERYRNLPYIGTLKPEVYS
ncbi:Hypoxanthine-guanine phosphoribosyltransferase [Euzebya pacifica]|jgi:hypoxanthine phosphoribosyltransferase|uniref:Hypoxanthine phosphoribosyltransferase n=1 Tax=Euzebya pacifica TaxID=1608957 RepID=A0A346Y2T3_9ACTN|nr:hypoxanthine phosphoribosyltransferase [Euzebya pacifica]AXV08780.1 Hypoxanthine-guanine phosphoribosyltransferase [Euzebya pacifica]